jgi:hypothetical protein
VLNPLLWLCAIITPVAAIAALFASVPLLYALILLAVLPPVATIFAFIGFAFADPNRLQSEEFLIQQQWVAAQIGNNQTHQIITLEGDAATPAANNALTGTTAND